MIHPLSYKSGLIAAGITIAYTLIAYLVGIELFTNFWMPMVIIFGIVVYLIFSLKKVRESLGNMSFATGFLNFSVMSALYVFVSQLFNFLLLNVIDPEFGIAVTDVIIDKTIGLMEGFGAPESEIIKAVDAMEVDFESQKSFLGALWGWIKFYGFFVIIGLIAAAVMKSKKSEFSVTVEEVE